MLKEGVVLSGGILVDVQPPPRPADAPIGPSGGALYYNPISHKRKFDGQSFLEYNSSYRW